MCCGDPTKHHHADLRLPTVSAMHCDGIPEDLTPERMKSAFELDIAADALQDDGSAAAEETTAFLPEPSDIGDHDIQASIAGAQRLAACRITGTQKGRVRPCNAQAVHAESQSADIVTARSDLLIVLPRRCTAVLYLVLRLLHLLCTVWLLL